MKKSNIWKKRAVLLGLSATLATTNLLGCYKKTNEVEFAKINYDDDELIDYFVPNLALLEYEINGKIFRKIGKLISNKENDISYQLLTSPELKVNIHKNGDMFSCSIYDTFLNQKLSISYLNIDKNLYRYIQQYCEFKEGLNITKDTILKIENEYNIAPLTIKNTLAQDVNLKWKEYLGLPTIFICQFEENEPYVLLMFIEKKDKNKRVYRSLTHPETFLEETLDREMNILKSELKTDYMLPKQNEQFTKLNKFYIKFL